ncbi:MAG TPA: right-handed parallel beta-helix repeat-containing protein [Verrucomicrobiae bacterium]|nr:right-handed parallel beta-helix repeat-containing protein [Verrucomicrobiae bacterium]
MLARRAAAFVAMSVLAGCAANPALVQSAAGPQAGSPAVILATGPVAPFHVCGNASLLAGPSAPPPGAVTIAAGDDTAFAPAPKTTYWFAPGTHTFGSSPYGQIIPEPHDVFIGAPGAILDGKLKNLYAFTQHAAGVTVEYLTIQNFGPAGSNQNAGVVNHDSGPGWIIEHNTIQDDAGAGAFLGSRNVLRYNCLRDNGQYGFSVYAPGGVSNVVVDHNEIAGNDTYHWEQHVSGCGCTGGGKFWDTDHATITDNWIHNNVGPGLWADTDNNDFDISGNYLDRNDGEAVIIEISYNASIVGNVMLRNALVYGPKNPGFPTGAIYISESGGDARVPARYSTIEIADNAFDDDWAGVVLWENADRFCNSPANTSTGYCTLVDPRVVNLHTCVAGTIRRQPYYGDCRWKTQNVVVERNTFSFDPSSIAGCTVAATCGFQGLFSNWGTYPSWSPYQGQRIERAITFAQHDRFRDNAYTGPWHFMAHDQSVVLSASQWQAAPYRQDRGSSFSP